MMIVNQTESGLEVIYQPAHALLSTQVAGRWREDARPSRWWQTLNAVAQHDNGWHEWEIAPTLNEEGIPRNFTEITPFDAMAQWRRGVERGRHQARWVGLLISRHATALYEERRGELPELDEFLDEQAALQARWTEELATSEAEVDHAYAMIRWSDWFSLILCWRRLPGDGSAISVGPGPDDVRYEMRRLGNNIVTLDPWPFNEKHFILSVEARYLLQSTFENERALREALKRAEVRVKQWEMRGGRGS